ncbi:hypothetical protein KEM48_004943 [Puccinia striiformis f. sp. tritici PST-130]|nr:hypothetical protein KEM48_004943 [Puccinia striiformis f. sp. tritici PST-130]
MSHGTADYLPLLKYEVKLLDDDELEEREEALGLGGQMLQVWPHGRTVPQVAVTSHGRSQAHVILIAEAFIAASR